MALRMSQDFATHLTRCPIPHEAGPAGEARVLFPDVAPDLRELLAGAAGCSPYLFGLMATQRDWIAEALSGDPSLARDAELSALGGLSTDALGPRLRQAKARLALLTALADLGGVWPLEFVTGALTDLADAAVHHAMVALVGDEIRRGRIPGATEADVATAAGMVSLAMGKMGAGELNYSSDIDLICLFDDGRFDPSDVQEARAAFIRVTRRMTALLSDRTAGGYVFRTDLRLRPDASVTPVCISMSAAELYYEAQGRTWERAAYIKARPCGGDMAAGARFLQVLTPFVWRRHLDFAAIQDAHDMRLRIRDHKGLAGPLVVEGHNMKLGRGGIREIEFFTQTRQLIAGGRDPDLRLRGTVPGLRALAAKGWVPEADAEELVAHYRDHRLVEHRIQMINDAQTHDMPATPQGVDRIARLMGLANTEDLRRGLLERLSRVHEMTEGFFAPDKAGPRPEMDAETAAIVEGWRSYPSLRTDRAVAIFRRLEPELLMRLGRAAHPGEALRQFDGFLQRLPSGVQLFSLFESNPQLIDLIVDICATAPGLASYLSRNAGVLDAVIGGSFFAPWPGKVALTATLTRHLAQAADYERALDAARRWAKEWHFRIGVHHLRGLSDAAQAAREYADLADAVVAAVWPLVQAEFFRKHGPAPGRGAAVIGMGSLGAERLNAASDLDLLVIYDADGNDSSEGPRPLDARSYYARLTQALVTALSAPMAEGRLYEVDMRLRPSGRKGPVATSLAAWQDYQMAEAWTWEHLALTRARVIVGPADLSDDVEAVRLAVLAAKSGGATLRSDTAGMRARIFAAKAPDGEWEAKIGPGRLQDIELLAQCAALAGADRARRVEAQLRAAVRSGFLSRDDEARLQTAYRFFWRLHAGGRLLTDRPLDMEAIGEGGQAFLLRETGAGDLAELAATLAGHVANTSGIVARVLGTAPGGMAGSETPWGDA